MQIPSISHIAKGLRALPTPQFCSVVSTSTDIYTNLSIEETIRETLPFRDVVNGTPSHTPLTVGQDEFRTSLEKKLSAATSTPSKLHFTDQIASLDAPVVGLLYSYINTPCVVIGRNQNPWKEVSMGGLTESASQPNPVRLARRNSGGGTVYHDTGNVCFSFMSHRSVYDPARSIELVRQYLLHRFPMIQPSDLSTTKRNDLFLNGKKITGSAMKITAKGCYHHCTLLVSSDRSSLGKYLRPSNSWDRIITTSVDSVRSPVTTLAMELGQEAIVAHVGSGAPLSEGVCPVAAALQHDFAEFFASSEVPRDVLLGASQVDTVPNVWKEGMAAKEATSEYLQSLPSGNGGKIDKVGASLDDEAVLLKHNQYTTASWQLLDSTPKFKTFISIDLVDLMAGTDAVEFLQDRKGLEMITTVEKGVIKEIAVRLVEPDVDADVVNSSWIGTVLTTLFEGIAVRSSKGSESGGVALPVSFIDQLLDMDNMAQAAIRAERSGGGLHVGSGIARRKERIEQTKQIGLAAPSDAIPEFISNDDCWLLLQAVVRAWEHKNAW